MSLRVLLVDDEEELVSSLVERLSFRGVDACYATTGDDALRIVQQGVFDVVVLDVKMPGLSGLPLMLRLAEIRQGMKFIFLTGHGSQRDFDECSKAGAFCYLGKPVDIGELVKTIRMAVA